MRDPIQVHTFDHPVLKTLAGACLALSVLCDTASAQPAETAASRYVLEKAIQVSRHGVRPPTDAQKMHDATGRAWPRWLVADGHLTGHGYLAASLMGAWQAQHYRQAGLLAPGCPMAGDYYVLPSPKQRTRATAAALLDGMFPGCGAQASEPHTPLDALFQTDQMAFARLDPAQAIAGVTKAMGGSAEQLRQRLQPQMQALKAAVCVDGAGCPFYEQPWVLRQGDDGRLSVSGLELASSIGESIRLAYSEGKPLREVAFGNAADAQAVSALAGLHRAKYQYINDTPYIARRGGSQLMTQIVLALEQGTALAVHGAQGNPPPVALMVLVAHDTNLAQLRSMLGFHWQLGEYQPDNIPPGSALMFERYRDSVTGERFVRTRFVAQSLDQIRALTPLQGTVQPLQAQFDAGACNDTAVGRLCALQAFTQRLRAAIDASAVAVYEYRQSR